MESRRSRVQEKRFARHGILFLVLSVILIILFFTLGIQTLVKVANLTSDINKNKNSSTPNSDDKTPPGPPNLEINSNFATKDDVFIFKGKAEAGSTLKLYRDNEILKEITIGDNSRFEFNIQLTKGPNSIWVTATDVSANTSEKSNVLIVTYDPDPPELEIASPVDGKEFYTDERAITIEGETDPQVKVLVNNRVAIVTPDGKFSTKITLNEGKNEINIVATDPAENKTEKIITVSYSP